MRKVIEQETPDRYYVVGRNNINGKAGSLMFGRSKGQWTFRSCEAEHWKTEKAAMDNVRKLKKQKPISGQLNTVIDVYLIEVSDRQVANGFSPEDLKQMAIDRFERVGVLHG